MLAFKTTYLTCWLIWCYKVEKVTLKNWTYYIDRIPDTKNRNLPSAVLGKKLKDIYPELKTWPKEMVAEAYVFYSEAPAHSFTEYYINKQLNLKYEHSFIEFLMEI